MKKYLAFAAIALAAAVSCQKEAAPAEEMPVAPVREGYVEVTLTATSDAQTKAVLDGNTVVWAVGEEVAVYPGDATTPEKFTVKAVDFDQVTITGSVPAGTTSFIAVYPFKQARSRSGETLHMILPESQTVPSGGNIDPKAMSSVAYFADATAKPQFKNVFSLIEFKVSKPDGIRDAGFYADCSEASYYLGEIEVKVSTTGEAPVVTNLLGGFNTTVLPASGTQFEADKSYYAVMPPCENPVNFGFYINTESKVASKEAAAGKTLARNKGLSVGNLTTDDLVWKWEWIHNAQELNAFLAEAPAYTADDEVLLANDIDMTGESITTCGNWAGIFNGNGYKIKNWTSDGVALFGINKGTITGLTFDESCSLSFPLPKLFNDEELDKAGTSFGFLTVFNDGTVSECINNADITATWTENTGRAYYAPLIGNTNVSNSVIDGCGNNGDITITFAGQENVPYIGTIAGRSAGTNGQLTVKDCFNTGNVTVKNNGVGDNIYIGGLFGTVNSGGLIQNCQNSGEVSYEYVLGGTGAYVNMGGVVGYTAAKIEDCTNTADITYESAKDNSVTRPNIGGVAGYVSGGITGSSNSGAITVTGMFGHTNTSTIPSSAGSMPYPAFGGVAGCVGHNTKTVMCDNCTNTGKITVDAANEGGGYMRVGGLAGSVNGSMNSCTNSADVEVKSAGKQSAIGGLVGYCQIHKDGELEWKDCTNEGAVTLSSAPANTTFSYVGGIVGNINKTMIISGCTNRGAITTTSPSLLRVGGIAGLSKIIENSSNYGAISVTGATWGKKADSAADYSDYASSVGGLAGFGQGNIFGCEVKCSVTSNSAENSFIGGLVGGLGNTAQDYYDSIIDAQITAASGVCTGIVLGGQINNQKTVNLGLPGQQLTIKSTTSINGTAVSGTDVAARTKIVGHIETESGHADYIQLTNVILE